VGFEWPDIEGVFGKLKEETHELREAMTALRIPVSPGLKMRSETSSS
jgi:hypothetical protein